MQQLFQPAALLVDLFVFFLRPRRGRFRRRRFRRLRLPSVFAGIIRKLRSLFRRCGHIVQQLPAALICFAFRPRFLLRRLCREVLFDVVFPFLLFRFRSRSRFCLPSGSKIQVQIQERLSFALLHRGRLRRLFGAVVFRRFRLRKRLRLRRSLFTLGNGGGLGNDAHDGGIQIGKLIRSGVGSFRLPADSRHVRIDRVLVSQHEFPQDIPEIRRILCKKRCFCRHMRLVFLNFRIVRSGAKPVSLRVIRRFLYSRGRGGLFRLRIREHPKQRRVIHIAADRRVFLRRHVGKVFDNFLFSAAVFAFSAALPPLLRLF